MVGRLFLFATDFLVIKSLVHGGSSGTVGLLRHRACEAFVNGVPIHPIIHGHQEAFAGHVATVGEDVSHTRPRLYPVALFGRHIGFVERGEVWTFPTFRAEAAGQVIVHDVLLVRAARAAAEGFAESPLPFFGQQQREARHFGGGFFRAIHPLRPFLFRFELRLRVLVDGDVPLVVHATTKSFHQRHRRPFSAAQQVLGGKVAARFIFRVVFHLDISFGCEAALPAPCLKSALGDLGS